MPFPPPVTGLVTRQAHDPPWVLAKEDPVMKVPAALDEFYRTFPTERRCWETLRRVVVGQPLPYRRLVAEGTA